jgi:hypothetical protein
MRNATLTSRMRVRTAGGEAGELKHPRERVQRVHGYRNERERERRRHRGDGEAFVSTSSE